MRTPHDGVRLTYNPRTRKMEKVEGYCFLGITHVSIPWNWLEICAAFPGNKVFAVAALICLQKDLRRSQRITLPKEALSRCGISRSVLSKSLVALHEAGLIEVFHKPGQKSEIVVVDPQGTAAMAKREKRLKPAYARQPKPGYLDQQTSDHDVVFLYSCKSMNPR